MKIAVIGANGQLGSDIGKVLAEGGHDVCSVTHADIELSNLESVVACLRANRPEVVVNTAAMHHVENCERQPERAYAVNAIGARNLAIVTRDLGAALVHVSTDYVFDGEKKQPYVEEDLPLPLNVYGNTKLAGEYFIRVLNRRHFILRTSALYGKQPCRAKGGENFVDLMLRLARDRGQVRVVADEFVSPTSTVELAHQIAKLIASEAYGLYHATAEGSCSWYEFAKEIYATTEVPVKLEAATPEEFSPKVRRPGYSVLENRALKASGLNVFRRWQDGLHEYLCDTQLESVR
jgi:dTDP-4-dehydrorhamnose reductase